MRQLLEAWLGFLPSHKREQAFPSWKRPQSPLNFTCFLLPLPEYQVDSYSPFSRFNTERCLQTCLPRILEIRPQSLSPFPLTDAGSKILLKYSLKTVPLPREYLQHSFHFICALFILNIRNIELFSHSYGKHVSNF